MLSVPKSERKNIVITGKRNAGKSSLINALLDQDMCIVSNIAGTTTDPVKKAMELAPFGPVVLVDTAGIDDKSELGNKRINKTIKEITNADFLLYVLDASEGPDEIDYTYFRYFKKCGIPFAVVINKIDLGISIETKRFINETEYNCITISCSEKTKINELKKKIASWIPNEEHSPLIGDLVGQGETVIFVVPIDLGAPKGRLIMPQVQAIREALDEDSIVIVCKDKELRSVLGNLKSPPKLVVTDSQAVMRVAADVPDDIQLTTFSILMARYKGDLLKLVEGLKAIDSLENGDKVLIAEACSHHAQEDDIGRIKIPRWLKNFTRKNLIISHSSGKDFPEDLSDFKLVIHCGGCTLTSKEMTVRIKQTNYACVPIVNYGVLISYLHGAIPRALEPFQEAMLHWEKQSTHFLF